MATKVTFKVLNFPKPHPEPNSLKETTGNTRVLFCS